MNTVYVIIFFLAMTAVLSLWSLNVKKSSWEGTLTEKHKDEDDESGKTLYYLIFQTNVGKKRVSLSSDQKTFNSWNIGDKGIKKSGEYLPQQSSS